MDIAIWLRSLGLGKYEAAFRENEIDETVLPSLTEEHLKQLGVTALGHRVKLLDAIAVLRTDAGGKPVDAATTPSPPTAISARWALMRCTEGPSSPQPPCLPFVRKPRLPSRGFFLCPAVASNESTG